MTAKLRNVTFKRGAVYYRWKKKGRDFYERLPDLDHPDFLTAYAAIETSRQPKVVPDRRLAAPVIKRWNARQVGRERIERAIPSWLVNLAREARKRSTRRHIEFTLSRADLSTLAQRAGGLCEVTGIAFEHERHEGSLYRPFAPSIDRIDPRQGYTLRNVRLTCVIVNTALNQWGEQPFWRMVEGALQQRWGNRALRDGGTSKNS